MTRLSRKSLRADKAGLSAGASQRRYRETPDVVAGLRRIIRSVGKRLATEDPEDLVWLVALEYEVERAWATAVAGLRKSCYTDGEIGRALGITKQAVQQRWPRHER